MPTLADVQRAFAAALLDPDAPVPEPLTSHTGARPPARFGVYRRNVAAGIVQVLEARFPVVRRLVGDEFFRGMALHFLRASPPISPILMRYGEAFPAFVAAFEPAADLPYLADVARLEWLQHEAYHAADAMPLGAAELAGLPAERIGAVRLGLHPSLRLLRSPYPVLAIWKTNTEDAVVKPLSLASGGDDLMILRPSLAVELHRLRPGVVAFVSALAAGLALASATAQGQQDADSFDLQAALAGLIRSGAIVSYEL
jgi:hypothetical protein